MAGVMAMVALFLAICTAALAVGAWEERHNSYAFAYMFISLCFCTAYTALVA